MRGHIKKRVELRAKRRYRAKRLKYVKKHDILLRSKDTFTSYTLQNYLYKNKRRLNIKYKPEYRIKLYTFGAAKKYYTFNPKMNYTLKLQSFKLRRSTYFSEHKYLNFSKRYLQFDKAKCYNRAIGFWRRRACKKFKIIMVRARKNKLYFIQNFFNTKNYKFITQAPKTLLQLFNSQHVTQQYLKILAVHEEMQYLNSKLNLLLKKKLAYFIKRVRNFTKQIEISDRMQAKFFDEWNDALPDRCSRHCFFVWKHASYMQDNLNILEANTDKFHWNNVIFNKRFFWTNRRDYMFIAIRWANLIRKRFNISKRAELIYNTDKLVLVPHMFTSTKLLQKFKFMCAFKDYDEGVYNFIFTHKTYIDRMLNLSIYKHLQNFNKIILLTNKNTMENWNVYLKQFFAREEFKGIATNKGFPRICTYTAQLHRGQLTNPEFEYSFKKYDVFDVFNNIFWYDYVYCVEFYKLFTLLTYYVTSVNVK